MATRKRIEITIETDRVVILRRNRPTPAQCQECGSEADMPDLRTLRDLVDAQESHLGQSPDGLARICLESLLKSKGGRL